MRRFVTAALMSLCAIVLAGALAACAPGASTLTSEQQANRAYMSQVNAVMAQLGENLESFVDAVSRNDLVNMRTQADNAYRVLDELEGIEAPDELVEVKNGYVDGTKKLREALDSYIDLYTELESGSFDQSTYDKRIQELQKSYDEAVDQLKSTDEKAASYK